MNECFELTEELTLGDLLKNISVNNEDIWGEETVTWLVFFYLYIVVFGILFCLLIALTLYVVTQRKRAERPKVKKVNTFYAINGMIIVLGVLRVIHLIFDPYRVEGWIEGAAAHHIFSIVFSMGFPSLTASYLLVFITLWMTRKIKGGFTCIQKLGVIIPLCAFQYVVTFIIELITISNQYEVIYLIIACDLFFSIWGIAICVSFLVAGTLLIKSIGNGNRESRSGLENLQSVRRDSDLSSRYTHANRLGSRRFTFSKRQSTKSLSIKRKGVEHRQRAMMKVIIVTCVTALLGILYSILSTANVAMAIYILHQKECVNEAKGSRAVWLLLRYLERSLELLLCLLLLYAVADTTKMMKYLFKKWKRLCGSKEDDSVDFNTTDYEKSMSELEASSSTLDRSVPMLSNIKPLTNSDKIQLASVTEESIHEGENGVVKNVENGVVENKSTEHVLLENGTGNYVLIENGTSNPHQGLPRQQSLSSVFRQGDQNSELLSVKQQMPKSHSDSAIIPNGNQNIIEVMKL